MKKLILIVAALLVLSGGGFAWWKFKLPPFKASKKHISAKGHENEKLDLKELGAKGRSISNSEEAARKADAEDGHGEKQSSPEQKAAEAVSHGATRLEHGESVARPERDPKAVQRLAMVYEGLPAQRTADLMKNLPEDLSIELLRGMDEQKAGKVLLSLDPKLAAKFTVALSLSAETAAGTAATAR